MEVSCNPAAALNKPEQEVGDTNEQLASCGSESSSSLLSTASTGTTRSSSRRKSAMKQTLTSTTTSGKSAKLRSLNNVKFENELSSNSGLDNDNTSSNSTDQSDKIIKDENQPIIRQSARRPATPKPVSNIKKHNKLENVTGTLENQDIKGQNQKLNITKSPRKLVNGVKGRNKVPQPVFCPNDENTLDGFNNTKEPINNNSNVIQNGHNKVTEPVEFHLTNKMLPAEAKQPIEQIETTPSPDINVVDCNDDESRLTIEGNTESNGLNIEDESQTGSLSGGCGQGGGDSNSNSASFKKKRKKRVSNYGLYDQIDQCVTSAAGLFIYKWPQEKVEGEELPDTYLLQEQVTEFLGVKSFKRKYPDLFRRLIDIKERVYLRENNVVTETQCDLGLTALRLNDCLDIMVDHYPEKYTEVSEYLAIKKRKEMTSAVVAATTIPSESVEPVKAGRFGRAMLSEADRMKELMRKAIKSVTSYNQNLQKEKKTERKSYFDHQTMRVQKVRRHNLVAVASTHPNGQYPVALLQGQYQYHYRKYTSDELKQLPLNTVLYQAETPAPLLYDEWKMKQMNPNKHYKQFKKTESSDEEEPMQTETPEPRPKMTVNSHLNATQQSSKQSLTFPSASSPSIGSLGINLRVTASPTPTVASLIQKAQASNASPTITKQAPRIPVTQQTTLTKPCNVCQKSSAVNAGDSLDQFMIHCTGCDKYSHPLCLQLNPALVRWSSIKEYNWQCMDCKKCSGCLKPHDEDKMMFCDRCDRGFHTYCVGLTEVPSGSWFCKQCNLVDVKSENVASPVIKRIDETNSTPIIKTQLKTPKLATPSAKVLDKVRAGNSTSKEKSGRRGRPLGSLNKPKDPNSPTKKLSKYKLKQLDHSLNYSGYGDISGHENSNTNPLSIDESSFIMHDEHSQSLSYDNYTNIINNPMNMSENFIQSTF